MIMHRAREKGGLIHAGLEAEKLLVRYPDCGMTLDDIIDAIMGSAVGLGIGLEDDDREVAPETWRKG